MSSEVNMEKVQEQSVSTEGKQVSSSVEVSPEQIKYANLLFYCSWCGIGMLAITFILYMSGMISSYIEPSQLPQYWGLSVHDYLVATNAPTGWGWLGMLKYGDYLNFVGIAFLALLTIVGYAVLLFPAYLRNKDIPYAAIVFAEIFVLTLAASGILKSGH